MRVPAHARARTVGDEEVAAPARAPRAQRRRDARPRLHVAARRGADRREEPATAGLEGEDVVEDVVEGPNKLLHEARVARRGAGGGAGASGGGGGGGSAGAGGGARGGALGSARRRNRACAPARTSASASNDGGRRRRLGLRLRLRLRVEEGHALADDELRRGVEPGQHRQGVQGPRARAERFKAAPGAGVSVGVGVGVAAATAAASAPPEAVPRRAHAAAGVELDEVAGREVEDEAPLHQRRRGCEAAGGAARSDPLWFARGGAPLPRARRRRRRRRRRLRLRLRLRRRRRGAELDSLLEGGAREAGAWRR